MPSPRASAAQSPLDASQRLDLLRTQLTRAAHRERIWTYGWGSFFSASLVGNAVGAAAGEARERATFSFGALGSAAGVLTHLLMPPKVLGDAAALDALIRRGGPAASPCTALAAAERAMERGANDQRFGRGWLQRAGSILFNVALGLGLGLGYGQRRSALMQSALGVIIGELRIRTRPDDLTPALQRYRDGQREP